MRVRALVCILGGLACATCHGADIGGVLSAESAFQISATRRSSHVVEVTLTAAPGYGIYKDRLKITSETVGYTVTDVALPAGDKHHPKQFRGTTTFQVVVMGAGKHGLSLHAVFQGCGDIGICYPPAVRKVSVLSKGQDSPSGANALQPLGSSAGVERPRSDP